MYKKTKIIATYGPSVASAPAIRKLVRAGVNAFRINCSHGDRPDFEKAVKIVRHGISKSLFPVGIIFDIAGLKLRLARFDGEVKINRGDLVTLTNGKTILNEKRIGVNHPAIVASVRKGERLFIDDGKMMFEIVSTGRSQLVIKALNGGSLLSAKGINLPDSRIKVPSITAKDIRDIKAAVELGADFIALSFVRSAHEIAQARKISERAGRSIKIIAKLEKREAIESLEEIMQASDGVMIARGDLGVELPPADLPKTQKQIIALANRYHKPVIVATQMLESMRFSPRATRAEINDVASAVFDYADAVMLSAETASGLYPTEAVQTMSDVLIATEPAAPGHPNELSEREAQRSAPTYAVAEAVSRTPASINVKVICAFTTTGYTPELVSNLFPVQPILALTPMVPVARQLSLFRSLYTAIIRQPRSFEQMLAVVNREVKRYKLAKKGDWVVVTGGHPFGSTVPTSFMKYHKIG